VALVGADVTEECIAFIIGVTRLGKLATTLAVTSNRTTLLVTTNVVANSPTLVIPMMKAIGSSETSIHIKVTWSNIPEDGILHSRREILKSYTVSIQVSILTPDFRKDYREMECENMGWIQK
jgi:hypothetical protein